MDAKTLSLKLKTVPEDIGAPREKPGYILNPAGVSAGRF